MNFRKFCKKIAGWHSFENVSSYLILITFLAFILSTEFKTAQWHDFWYIFDRFIGVVFVLEYIVRIYSVKKTMREALKPIMLMDLVVIISIFYPVDYNFIILRLLRLFKLIRILRLQRYQIAIKTLQKVWIAEREPLILTGIFFITMMIISSGMIYIFEGDQVDLSSFLRCIYWAIITGTGVGYGDVVPITGAGRVIASLTALVGLLSYSMITVIFASSFTRELDILKRKS